MSLGKCLLKQNGPFVEHLTDNGFTYLGQGSFRQVYGRGNIVIKVPMNDDGAIDNMVEARAWKEARSKKTRLGLYVAPCRLLINDSLMMVKVVEADYDSLPAWCTVIDQRQAGYYKNRVVAFDFALDTLERLMWEKEWGVRSNFFRDRWLHKHNYIKPAIDNAAL
jgi:hypothetical protein